MNNDQLLRETIKANLKGNTHMSFSDAVKDFPLEHINTKPSNVSYSFWHLLEHIRRTQIDILEYIRNPDYKEPKWPDDYWPKKKATTSSWNETITSYTKDVEEAISLLDNPKTDLFKRVARKDGPTLLHELFLISDHTSYHIGEFAILRQVTNIWPKNHK